MEAMSKDNCVLLLIWLFNVFFSFGVGVAVSAISDTCSVMVIATMTPFAVKPRREGWE